MKQRDLDKAYEKIAPKDTPRTNDEMSFDYYESDRDFIVTAEFARTLKHESNRMKNALQAINEIAPLDVFDDESTALDQYRKLVKRLSNEGLGLANVRGVTDAPVSPKE